MTELNESAQGSPVAALLSEEEAAKRLGKSRQWLRNLRLDGEGPNYVDMGNTVRYRPQDVDEWLLGRIKKPTKVARKTKAAAVKKSAGKKPAADPAK